MEYSLSVSLLVLLFLPSICPSDNSTDSNSSWAKLQISPDSLCSMPYGSFRVNIYEHAYNQKSTTLSTRRKYYYAPIALLDHKSAVSDFNNVTNQAEMRFRGGRNSFPGQVYEILHSFWPQLRPPRALPDRNVERPS